MRKRNVLIFIILVLAFPIVTIMSSFGCTSGGGDVTITYNANGGYISQSSETVSAGSSIILPLPDLTGYVFNGWYSTDGKKVGLAGGSYIANKTATLHAQWTKNQYSESLRYSYEPGISAYYVDYEIQRYVNGFLYDTYIDSAYFDSYATAWAFSLTGGPNPVISNEEVWLDGINRWWVAEVRESYKVDVWIESSETLFPYYGPTFPGTNLAPITLLVSINGHSAYLTGAAGPTTSIETYYHPDPGYIGEDEEIRVDESWWSVYYAEWVYGIPDIYTTLIVPTNGVIYSCR